MINQHELFELVLLKALYEVDFLIKSTPEYIKSGGFNCDWDSLHNGLVFSSQLFSCHYLNRRVFNISLVVLGRQTSKDAISLLEKLRFAINSFLTSNQVILKSQNITNPMITTLGATPIDN